MHKNRQKFVRHVNIVENGETASIKQEKKFSSFMLHLIHYIL